MGVRYALWSSSLEKPGHCSSQRWKENATTACCTEIEREHTTKKSSSGGDNCNHTLVVGDAISLLHEPIQRLAMLMCCCSAESSNGSRFAPRRKNEVRSKEPWLVQALKKLCAQANLKCGSPAAVHGSRSGPLSSH